MKQKIIKKHKKIIKNPRKHHKVSSVRDEMETAKVTLLFKPSGSIRTWRKEESLGTTMSTCKNLLLSLDRSCFQVV